MCLDCGKGTGGEREQGEWTERELHGGGGRKLRSDWCLAISSGMNSECDVLEIGQQTQMNCVVY
jgi:hypothetical protein